MPGSPPAPAPMVTPPSEADVPPPPSAPRPPRPPKTAAAATALAEAAEAAEDNGWEARRDNYVINVCMKTSNS